MHRTGQFQDVEGTHDVALEVANRVGHRQGNGHLGREVNDDIGLELVEDLAHVGVARDVAVAEGHPDLLQQDDVALNADAAAVVDDEHLVLPGEAPDGVDADEPQPAGDQYLLAFKFCHKFPSLRLDAFLVLQNHHGAQVDDG